MENHQNWYLGLIKTGGLLLALVDTERRLGPRVLFGGASEDKGAISRQVIQQNYYFQTDDFYLNVDKKR